MRCYRLRTQDGPRLVVDVAGTTYDLTTTNPATSSFRDLAAAATLAGTTVDALVHDIVDDAERTDGVLADADLLAPVRPAEVWGAGVTYAISEQARETESGTPDVYLDVYEADRPELFFKSTPSRTVGPGESIGIRGDSDWNVPEPELALVLYRGEVVGYTVGNDVSSRDIEGKNPLYLPQAKVYARSCSLGPCVATPETVTDPHDLRISLRIERDGETVISDETSTSELARSLDELVSYLTRHNTVPECTVLLTGTSLVPPDDFTLRSGDVVSIQIDSIGRLENDVVVV